MQYDLVLNGWSSGRVRPDPSRALLERSFALQGHTFDSMQAKFGACSSLRVRGAAPWRDRDRDRRWAALMADQATIREVMAFPKTSSGIDLMLDAPSAPDPASTPSSAFARGVADRA